jgi:hypothetical protein
MNIMMDLFDNVWGSKEEIVVENAIEVTLPVGYMCFVITIGC